MATPIATTPAVFGLPPGGGPLSRFRRAVVALGPRHLYLCDDAVGATSVADYTGRASMTTVTCAPGSTAIAPGERASVGFSSGTYAQAPSALSLPPSFTLGVIASIDSFGGGNNDCCMFGAWSGPGTMLYAGITPTVRLYVGSSFASYALDMRGLGPTLVVGTYDGVSARLYVNGVLVAGPTAASTGNSSTPLSINRYSTTTCTAGGSVSDAFMLAYALTAAQVAALQSLR